MKNIVLIGMPGSGKSTLGVLLAKSLGYSFTDTDLIISRIAEKPLQRILDEDGLDVFLKYEERVGARLVCDDTVVATGGSMVLSEAAMKNLKSNGTVVYINVPLNEIKRRVTDIKTRGIAFRKHETLDDVYRERTPLYEKYADITVDFVCGKIEDAVNAVIERLKDNL
ncbi:MAG: shikimate kinase [Clostridiales bacterium]|nr:shikimate kinase [Clostridiales bacterium]